MKYFTTETFLSSLSTYCKKDEYLNCRTDLCDFFKGKPIDEIFSQPILVAPNKDFNFIKSRINNSCNSKGKSAGFRLYYYVDKVNERIYLLGFYPKTGKYGRDDLTDTEVKFMIRSFGVQKANSTLIEVDINNELAKVKAETAKVTASKKAGG